MICTPNDKIVKNEMDEACSAYGGEERHIQIFCGKPQWKEITLNTQA